jgi:HPt (histidine-containing phosphotransfer) domain-containing protein
MPDPDGPAKDAAVELSELRDFFRPRLAERVREIELAWEAMAATAATAGPDADSLRRLHRLAHSLGGAAGTFGFAAVGDAARALERHLQSAETATTATTAGARPELGEIEPLVAALRQAAAAALL